ncbi:hypothetical protein [Devosia ginsengisoli]|uniref:hypothetical protein n=1 Tax=Devosia ginsengisoli TaxID=400770 RepID=UPI0026ED6E63|nr:hypothetical protein [Devosia ginsengisoli]MCR6673234.1 hypothetical protein [Devosia ginsengisoli]
MSIVSLALRISAVRALQAAGTIAGASRVFDSAVMPIDKLVSASPEPFISISTEDEVDTPAGRDIFAGSRSIDFVIETAITKTVKLPAGQTPGDSPEEISIAVVDTDGNLEMMLAVLGRQITACLWGRGGGAWGDVFRSLAGTIREHRSRRGLPASDGQRFAARQTIFSIQPIAEPAFASELCVGTPLAAFLSAVEADTELAPMAPAIRHAIEGKPVDWPAFFTQSAVAAGLTEAQALAVGISDIGGGDSDPLAEIAIGLDDQPGAEWIVDAAAADAQFPEEPSDG